MLVSSLAAAQTPPDPVAEARDTASRAAEKMRLGEALLRLDDVRGACDAFSDAVVLLPTWWMPRLAAARCGRVTGMPLGKILENAEVAVRSRPQIPATHLAWALALEEAGRDSEAIAAYEATLRVHADLLEARFRLGVLLARANDSRAARRHLEEVLGVRPDYIVARVHLTRVYEGLGLLDEAEDGMRDMVAKSRYPAQAMANLVRFYERHGMSAKAREAKARYETLYKR